MTKLRLFLFCLLIFFSHSALLAAPAAQTLPGIITLSVEAGFGGNFREYDWLPVIIRASNDGEDVSGHLVVRPETSGAAVTNTFSTPITLPSGARQTVFLYITAHSFASQIRVELIDDGGVVIASQAAGVRSISQQDRLYVVLTQSATGSIDLTGARLGGFSAFQGNWNVENLPDRAPALDAVNLMLFTDVDSGAISSAQKQALTDWIVSGGHLVVTGGPNWQATAAGLTDLLPLTPEGSATLETLAPLGEWLSLSDSLVSTLDQQTVISTGSLIPEARTLISTPDGDPLLARRFLGEGVVDYLTVDPNTQPLRGWGSLPDLWYALFTTTGSTPGWSHGFGDWEQAARAVEILPGFDPLPDILPLCGFLFAYIALIGPINYAVLSRINRREWAWITIPVFILIFSVASWVFGSNLRGNEATLNRLAVVQTWTDSDRARVEGLIGLLSPRRAPYSLLLENQETLRPIPTAYVAGNMLARGAQASVDIREAEQFGAVDFTVDASFVAGFHLSGMIDKPPVSGSASVAYDSAIDGQQIVRGSVRNDGDMALNDPVILARGQSLQLNQPLAPGDVATFDLTLPGEGIAAPSPYLPGSTTPYFSARTTFAANASEQSVIDILGTESYDMNLIRRGANVETREQQAILRQQWLLSSLVNDSYRATGRGDHIYLAGWVDSPPVALDLVGANWSAQNSTVYLIELETELEVPRREVVIPPERFTWAVREYLGFAEVAPVELNMQTGEEVVFRFTPLPGAVLDTVSELRIVIENLNVGGRSVPLSLWDWQAETWQTYDVTRDGLTISRHQRYLGPENAVQVRLVADDIGGYLRIGQVGVEQRGTFETAGA